MKTPGFRSFCKEANSLDKLPDKKIRKWKKKERQQAKKKIKKDLLYSTSDNHQEDT